MEQISGNIFYYCCMPCKDGLHIHHFSLLWNGTDVLQADGVIIRSTKEILTSPWCWQYAVLLNRFSYPFELEKDLHLKGYHTLFQGSLPNYPKSMKCYLSRTPGRIPSERHQIGNLKKYYLLNAASLLPVLALELRDGEKVLDLCAAPGGKSIALLQCACPGYLHCNEYDSLRLKWLRQTLESFIPQPLINVIKVSELDGREMGDAQPEMFDKVLVDAPCSNDRSWLFSSDSQKASCRISQRRNLPLLQIELLSRDSKHGLTESSAWGCIRLHQRCWLYVKSHLNAPLGKDPLLSSHRKRRENQFGYRDE
ncbi:tRNA (cytosine(34)-C(5))-methyltransferase, mitochondrial isoform X4 [Piliocolobus tephrosceles]|uniref:tRNA (cytosine(34)-C(5))-methyltransferase, mitochondrial isoform X4 n=1 Tax=Piliocolobus tephrosceles TaxID=591936 RepID=UPI000E6B06DB|nr:tRNA (cytosine(34)-C(5))-methyltransferase, mitochondrial isoform X4 [Piliocolobus tephrosceles]